MNFKRRLVLDDYETIVARSRSLDALYDMQDELEDVLDIVIDIEAYDDGTFAFAYFANSIERHVINSWIQKQSKRGYSVWLEDFE